MAILTIGGQAMPAPAELRVEMIEVGSGGERSASGRLVTDRVAKAEAEMAGAFGRRTCKAAFRCGWVLYCRLSGSGDRRIPERDVLCECTSDGCNAIGWGDGGLVGRFNGMAGEMKTVGKTHSWRRVIFI